MTGGPKKWFMLQLWRLQQIAQLATVAMLAMSLSLQVWNYMAWRADQPASSSLEELLFKSPYIGLPFIFLVMAAIVWTFALLWDVRLKMWRDQQAVMIDKNPFAKEKMSPKEVALYEVIWLPWLMENSKNNPELKEAADRMREWIVRTTREDKATYEEVRQIYEYIGKRESEVVDLGKKTE